MALTATAIPVPVEQGCCFETVESIARSQSKSRPRQRCNTCGFMVHKHMTRAQALEAFTAHAQVHPSTHANLEIPLIDGVHAPVDYAEQHGIQAPIPAPPQQPSVTTTITTTPSLTNSTPPLVIPAQVINPHPNKPSLVVMPDSPISTDDTRSHQLTTTGSGVASTPPTADQYKVLTEMVKVNPQLTWSDEQEANRFLMGLESLLEFSPVRPTHWISLIMMMVPGKYELERTWVHNNIIVPLLSWKACAGIHPPIVLSLCLFLQYSESPSPLIQLLSLWKPHR